MILTLSLRLNSWALEYLDVSMDDRYFFMWIYKGMVHPKLKMNHYLLPLMSFKTCMTFSLL